MRQSLEQELEISAKTGDTARLITALEEGAPFVVDMVSNFGWHSDTGTLGHQLLINKPGLVLNTHITSDHILYPVIIDLCLLHGQFCIRTESCN